VARRAVFDPATTGLPSSARRRGLIQTQLFCGILFLY
jgi:hypothetical protein